MKTNIFYVYAYLRIDGTPYYIGKGHAKRIHNHHANVKVPPKDRRVKLRENLEEQEAYDYEMELIEKYGRKRIDEDGILYNVAVGGPYAATKLYTEEEKKEASNKASRKWYYKVKEDPDTWERMLKKWNSRDRSEYYKRPKVKKKMREAVDRYLKDLKEDPERYEEYLGKARKLANKTRERINADPELRETYLAKKREDSRKRYSTPEAKKKKSEQKKKYLQEMKKDPERYAAYLKKNRSYKKKRRLMGIPDNQC